MVETGAAVILLVVAGLLIHSFDRLMSKDLGFEPGNVLTVRVALPNRYADDAAFESFFERALERIRSLPGVERAAVSNGLPLEGGASTGVRGEIGPEPWTSATLQDVSAEYANVIGIPVLAGRWMTEEEVRNSAPVAVVSESVAMALWPGESPFGKRIGRFAPADQEQNWRTVVGLTTDVAMNMSQGPRGVVYSPFTESWFGASTYLGHSMIFGVRTSSGGTGTAIRDVLLDLEPDSAVTVKTYDSIIGDYVATTRFRRTMLVAFAGVAVGLAMLGISSVAAFSVTSRVREMGLRLALGARPGQIVRDMTRQGVQFPVLGLAIGLWLSTYVVRSISTFFSGMEPADSWAYLAVLVVGMVLVIVASWIPARRAARVNPIVALRYE
jgi:predicted permease